MEEIRFASVEHKRFYYEMLEKAGKNDNVHRAFFYCVGINGETRRNVERIFDFRQGEIRIEALDEEWQTDLSFSVTCLDFNLWRGYVRKSCAERFTPYELFVSTYAPYYYEAIRQRYPRQCRELKEVKAKER